MDLRRVHPPLRRPLPHPANRNCASPPRPGAEPATRDLRWRARAPARLKRTVTAARITDPGGGRRPPASAGRLPKQCGRLAAGALALVTSRATMSRTEQDVMCASTRRPSRRATPVIRRYGTRSFRLRPGQCSPRVTIIHPRSLQQDRNPVTRARSSNPGYLPGRLQRPSIGQAHSTKAQRRQRERTQVSPIRGRHDSDMGSIGRTGTEWNSARGHAASVSDDRAYQHPQADEEQDRGRDPGRRKPLTTIALTRSTTPPPRKMSAVAYHVSKMTQCQGWRAEARLSSRANAGAVYPCRAGLVIRPDRHA